MSGRYLYKPGTARRYFNEVVLPHHGEACLFWPFGRGKDGYARIADGHGQKRLAHRLACQAVKGPPPTPLHQAAHSCGKGNLGCVNPDHLSWKTRSENEADKILHGTHNRGERHVLAKLSAATVAAIREAKGNMTLRAAASHFGTSSSNVYRIQNGQAWRC